MSLENLLTIGLLKEHPPDGVEIQRLRLDASWRDVLGADLRRVAESERPAYRPG